MNKPLDFLHTRLPKPKRYERHQKASSIKYENLVAP